MIHGLDTGFLVAAEVLEHAQHVAARAPWTTVTVSSQPVAQIFDLGRGKVETQQLLSMLARKLRVSVP